MARPEHGNCVPVEVECTNPGFPRDLILRDNALLHIAYEMLIWAPLIPATRWSCSQPPADGNDCCLQLHLVAGIRGAQKRHHRFSAECTISLV